MPATKAGKGDVVATYRGGGKRGGNGRKGEGIASVAGISGGEKITKYTSEISGLEFFKLLSLT